MTVKDRIRKAAREQIALVPYDPLWPRRFEQEARRLRRRFGKKLILRIEHIGSTAIPGLGAKPIVDMLVEVPSLHAARTEIVPVLRAEGYEYFWRPTFGDDVGPWYVFLIKRKRNGLRTHHLHFITCRPTFQSHWDRLLFRDYLIAHRRVAREYQTLKISLATSHPGDRAAYTNGKSAFISRVMKQIAIESGAAKTERRRSTSSIKNRESSI